MAYRQVILLALLLCLAPACVKKAPAPEAPPPAPVRPEPGSKLLLDHEALSRELGCDAVALPLVNVERNALNPERVDPGGEVHHRLVYAFCPADKTQPETGTLTRRLLLKGRAVFVDQTRDFTLVPGRSAVDAFFLVPPAATPGTYLLEVEYRGARHAKGGKAVTFSAKEVLFIGREP